MDSTEVVFRNTFMLDVGQKGAGVGVYAADSTGEGFGLEFTAGSWSPSQGFSKRTVFGRVSTKFGGTLSSIPNGALLTGFDPERARQVRVMTTSGLVNWGGRESALVCSEPGALFRPHVLDDGSVNLLITNGGSCVPGGCLGFVLFSTGMDGGFSCPLRNECDDVCRWGRPRAALHPRARFGSFGSDSFPSKGPSFGFVEWDGRGDLVRFARVNESSRSWLGPFWPSLDRPPTRIQVELDGGGSPLLSNGRIRPEVHLAFLVWSADGGVTREETPFSSLLNTVDTLAELPTGVVLSGQRAAKPDAPPKDVSGAYLVDSAGTQVLGRFQTKSGFPIAPNVYVESQYFLIRPFLVQGDDADPRNYSGVTITPIELVPLD